MTDQERDQFERLQIYYSRRRGLDLVLILSVVVLGSMWSEFVGSALSRHVFRTGDAGLAPWQWLLSSLIGTVVLVLVLAALGAPISFFT